VHHLIEEGHDPVLKLAIVVVRDEQVSDPVQPPPPQSCAVVVELAPGSEEGRTETLDQVFLDAACGGDEARDVVVLDEEADHFAQAGRDEVGRVAEEDGALCLGADLWVELFGLRVGVDRFVRESPGSLCAVGRSVSSISNPRLGLPRRMTLVYHFVYEFDCPCEAVGLEAYAFVAVEQVLKRVRLVKVGALDARPW
jgi:hypothetical protein